MEQARTTHVRNSSLILRLRRFAVATLAVAAPCGANAQSIPEMRWARAEIRASALSNDQIGGSGLPGVDTKVVVSDPSKAGYYVRLLFVPAHTTSHAHSHRDDRVATLVSGEWHFGYGEHFDAKSLKTLPPGSVYSEQGGPAHNHFARTDADSVIVEISGYGPRTRSISTRPTIPH
jgi:hypothetical protein